MTTTAFVLSQMLGTSGLLLLVELPPLAATPCDFSQGFTVSILRIPKRLSSYQERPAALAPLPILSIMALLMG